MWPFSSPDSGVLLVCMANICRSPMAEGIMRAELSRCGLASQVKVDSAGTHVGQPGSRPDRRAQQVCQEIGVDISRCRARQVVKADFENFDYLLALDEDCLGWLKAYAGALCGQKILMLGAFSTLEGIPDPYYGNLAGFERVRGDIEDAVGEVIKSLFPNGR